MAPIASPAKTDVPPLATEMPRTTLQAAVNTAPARSDDVVLMAPPSRMAIFLAVNGGDDTPVALLLQVLVPGSEGGVVGMPEPTGRRV